MSRVGKSPVSIPKGVEVQLNGQTFSAKGPKGQLTHEIHNLIAVKQDGEVLTVEIKEQKGKLSRSQIAKKSMASALSGTTRALINNVVMGVSQGFVKKLKLVGVGYRAQSQGNKLNLSLGFSHPVDYTLPEGIVAKTPSQTEVEIEGIDKQLVGQVAAEIRSIRPPEPYKGKGVRYADEVISLKETKKK